MSLPDYLILFLLASAVIAAVAWQLRRRKNGGCAGCCGDCAACRNALPQSKDESPAKHCR